MLTIHYQKLAKYFYLQIGGNVRLVCHAGDASFEENMESRCIVDKALCGHNINKELDLTFATNVFYRSCALLFGHHIQPLTLILG